MYKVNTCIYNVNTCLYNVCKCIYNVCTWYNQLSQQVFVPNTEMLMQGLGISHRSLMQGTMRIRAVPVQKMVIFFMPDQMLQKQRSHQQVYQWPGEPGASRFWQTAYIARQAASSCRHKWQQDVTYCSFGRTQRLSSHNGWGTAEQVYTFWALIVQAHSGKQVNKYYIHVYTMHVCRWAMYTHCT